MPLATIPSMSDATGDLPLDPAAEELEWYRVCSVAEIEDEEPFFDTVGGRSLMAVRQGARIAVFDDRCPHLGASMIGATVVDGQIECPLHGACFDAGSGSVLDGPHNAGSGLSPDASLRFSTGGGGIASAGPNALKGAVLAIFCHFRFLPHAVDAGHWPL